MNKIRKPPVSNATLFALFFGGYAPLSRRQPDRMYRSREEVQRLQAAGQAKRLRRRLRSCGSST